MFMTCQYVLSISTLLTDTLLAEIACRVIFSKKTVKFVRVVLLIAIVDVQATSLSIRRLEKFEFTVLSSRNIVVVAVRRQRGFADGERPLK